MARRQVEDNLLYFPSHQANQPSHQTLGHPKRKTSLVHVSTCCWITFQFVSFLCQEGIDFLPQAFSLHLPSDQWWFQSYRLKKKKKKLKVILTPPSSLSTYGFKCFSMWISELVWVTSPWSKASISLLDRFFWSNYLFIFIFFNSMELQTTTHWRANWTLVFPRLPTRPRSPP